MWKATNYKIFGHMTNLEVSRMAGGRRSARAFPKTKTITKDDLICKFHVCSIIHRPGITAELTDILYFR